ncbi:hypothetical protein BH20ACT2_BH20ACT2_24870 [soil metagenome]
MDLTQCQTMGPILPPGRLAYGIQLPVQAQSSIFVEPWEAAAGAAELATIASAAEDAGFAYVAVCDHVAVPRPLDEPMGTTWYDTVATLGYLAAVTARITLLSHVYVLAHRHPLATAKAFATLDALSGGRMVLGVGAGHVGAEFELLGTDYANRGKLLDEAIDAVRSAFTHEYPTVDGPTWSFADAGQRPRPVRPGGPPIWVGGSSRSALRRAAERGDGWLPQGTTMAEMPDQIAYVRAHRRATVGDWPIVLGAIAPPIHVGEPAWDVGGHTLSGPPAKIAHVLGKYRAMGVDQVQVRFRNRSLAELLDQMCAFGADVAPRLA